MDAEIRKLIEEARQYMRRVDRGEAREEEAPIYYSTRAYFLMLCDALEKSEAERDVWKADALSKGRELDEARAGEAEAGCPNANA